jgi:hypothetical protein
MKTCQCCVRYGQQNVFKETFALHTFRIKSSPMSFSHSFSSASTIVLCFVSTIDLQESTKCNLSISYIPAGLLLVLLGVHFRESTSSGSKSLEK